MAQVTFLLPAAARFGAQRLSASSGAALGRATSGSAVGEGRRAQLLRHFPLPTGSWPIAALSRRMDATDAADAAWLLLEPAYLRPDINGVRLMGYGDSLGVTQADSDAFLPALRPLFGDAGFTLDAPAPQRWYLRLSKAARIPGFADPGDALGDDLFEHTAIDSDETPEARRWRALLSEAQVILHNHPRNAVRVAQGQLPVNAVWPWGGGTLPIDGVVAGKVPSVVSSADALLRALASGRSDAQRLPTTYETPTRAMLVDLDAMRDLSALDRDWLQPALADVRSGAIGGLLIDAGDGAWWRFGRWDRLRFWRRPRRELGG